MRPLYRVSFIVPEYDGHTDVPFTLFRMAGGQWPRAFPGEPPFAVDDYLPAGFAQADEATQGYVRDAIAECFSESEAEALVAYFRRHGMHDVTAAVARPVGLHTVGIGVVPVGGSDGWYMFTAEQDDPPPVPVWGYYDLQEARGGPCVADPNASNLVIRETPDGGMDVTYADGSPVSPPTDLAP